MDNVSRITDGLRKGQYNNSPHQAAEDLSILGGEFAYVLGQLEEILQRKPAVWAELRKNVKSDTSAERAWQSTPDGMKESSLRLRAKAIERMMSSLKSLIRMAELESRNLM